MQVKLKIAEKSDDKVLSSLFFDSVEFHGSTAQKSLAKIVLSSALIRKKLFRKYIALAETSWEHTQYSLILVDGQTVGFVWLNWSENNETRKGKSTIQDIYLKPAYRGRKIETEVMRRVLDFVDTKKLSLGFSAKPEWGLDDFGKA